MRMKYQHSAPVLDCAFYVGYRFLDLFRSLIFMAKLQRMVDRDNFLFNLQDPTHSWSGGLDAQLKTHDLNTDQGTSQMC